MSRPGPARPLARPAGFASRKVPSLCSAHFEAAVGLGGARFRAPLDLPVLIPRVKNGLPRGTRAASCERQTLQMPINAVAPPLACPSGRLRRGDIRGAGAFVPLPTFSGRFRYTGRVTAAKQHPSGRLRRCPTGSAYADEERGGFGAIKFARNPTALFLPAPSALHRPCFGFELRARADSHRA